MATTPCLCIITFALFDKVNRDRKQRRWERRSFRNFANKRRPDKGQGRSDVPFEVDFVVDLNRMGLLFGDDIGDAGE